MREDGLIGWLRRQSGDEESTLIGDDAALLPESDAWAITVDAQIVGTHLPLDVNPNLAARRALAVNLSDLAAVGAEPAYAFLSLSAPPSFDHRRFLRAFTRCCQRFGMKLAGGDLSRQAQLSIVVTLLGRKPAAGQWLERKAARSGDHLWVGGTLGEAAAGLLLQERGAKWNARKVELPEAFSGSPALCAAARRAVRRHLLPTPQLALGTWLGRRARCAAMDISDGLALDLHRLCRASAVGAEIEVERLPFASRFETLARAIDQNPQELALAGGEDYVLLFTLPPGETPPASFRCRRVGRIMAAPGIYRIQGQSRQVLAAKGWDHLS